MKSLKGVLFCAMMLSALVGLAAQTPEWMWAQQAGGSDGDVGHAIATDNEGNSLTTGVFYGSASFGSTTLISNGGCDVFIAKSDMNGNWLWARQAGGLNNEYGNSISTDAFDNIYVTGWFQGTAIFGTTILSTNYTCVYITKLDCDGNWLWARQSVVDYSDGRSEGLAIDNNGNCYITGYYYGNISFGTHTLQGISIYADSFIAKIDTNGNWLWAIREGSNYDINGKDIAVDNIGNIYVTGDFTRTAYFGDITLISNGDNYSDLFVAKLDNSGSWLWAVKAGGSDVITSSCIDVDISGNCYVTGNYSSSPSFGTISLDGGISRDIFITKLDTNGNWEWAKKAGGTGHDYGYGVTIDSMGNVYLTGMFLLNAYFGTILLNSNGNYDIFLGMLDNCGNWIWATNLGSTNHDGCYDITTDNEGNCYITGYFNSSIDIGSTNLVSYGDNDIFIAKLSHQMPYADFTSDTVYGLEPLSVQFTDLSLPGYGSISEWMWYFGDGDSSSDQNPFHTYQTHGLYTVSLMITNSFGISDELVRSDFINVLPRYPELIVTPLSINIDNVYLGSQSTPSLLLCRNVGTETLNITSLAFQQANSPFQVPEYMYPIEIAEGDSSVIPITFSPLVAGLVSDSLFIFNDSMNLPIATVLLTGTGEYVPPAPPGNVNIVMNGYDAVISWDAVTQTIFGTPITPDYYLVFYNGLPDPEGPYYYHGLSNTLQYTHHQVGLHADHMFYHVIAYKYYGREFWDPESLGLIPGLPEQEILRILDNVR
jgi:PKD repeat protein